MVGHHRSRVLHREAAACGVDRRAQAVQPFFPFATRELVVAAEGDPIQSCRSESRVV